MRLSSFLSFFLTFLILGCQSKQRQPNLTSADSLRVMQEIAAHRSAVDSFFRNDPDSPFNRDTTVEYEGINWFRPDVRFYAKSRLHRYDSPETVVVSGTKGEERRHLKYGYFLLDLDNREYRLNVYKFIPSDPKRLAVLENHLSVWFTDQTTGKETYEVGRYVDVETESSDPKHGYTIDFNRAYNPYCAYSNMYTCAIPRREDHLDVEIRAGEMKYKDIH